jgi:hypothetical protein
MKKILSHSRKIAAIIMAAGIWFCCVNTEATGVFYQLGAQTISSPAVVPPPSIGGSITFAGGANLNAPLGSATGFTNIFGVGANPDPNVLGTSGDYSSVPDGTFAMFTPFTFSPLSSASSDFTLWSFMVGPVDYSFLATSVAFVYQDANVLNIAGDGIAHIDGFSDTTGTWTITDTGTGESPVFTFGAGATVVPEPSTFALIVSFTPFCSAFVSRARTKSNRKSLPSTF